MGWKDVIYDSTKIDGLIERVDAKFDKLNAKRPLPSYVLKSLKDSLSIEWSYNSTAIEGNTLTLQETKVVIEDGLTIGGKSLREHFEVINHEQAIDFLEILVKEDRLTTERDISDIHRIIIKNIDDNIAGTYRTMGVRISGANFTPPSALHIKDMMEDMILWLESNYDRYHPIVLSSVFHHRFVWIHPFFDGNGRTGRLVMNMILMNHGFPPAIILKNDRKKYYAALNKANNGDYTKLILLVGQATERSLNIYVGAIENSFDDYQPISQIVEEDEVPYGQEYVSLLARRGKIDAFKEGRTWMTSKGAVLDYISQRERQRAVGK